MLAPWIGGAGAPSGSPPAAPEVGFRGMLAPWIGGAAAGPAVEPPAPSPAPSPGGGIRPPYRFDMPPELVEAQRRRLIEDDELMLLILSQMTASGLLH